MSTSKISVRQNNHFEKTTELENSSRAPLVHVFAENQKSPLMAAIQQQLKKNSYDYCRHRDMQQFKSTVETPLRKIFVVVCLDSGKDLIPNDLKIGSSKMVKLCTLGGQGSSNKEQPNFQKAEEVVRAIKDFSADYPATIRLSSVHSIRLSTDKKVASSRDLRKVATDANYQRAFYFKNYRGEYVPDEDPTYDNFIEMLEKAGSFQPFKSVRDLQKLQAPNRKKKYLILASTNAASLQVIQELKKAKIQYFHYILLGKVKPKSQFLDKEVLLVSNDARAHVQFLQNNGFASPILQKIGDRLAMQPLQLNQNIGKVQYKATPGFDYYQGQESKIVNLQPHKVGEQQPEKKKIRKIKSPTKSKQSQISHIQHEHDQSQNSLNNVNIVISKHKDQPIVQNQQFRTNKQGERIYKKESVKEVQEKKQAPYFSNTMNSNNNYFDARIENFSNPNPPSRFDAVSPSLESQFAAKKPSNIESKYRNPSVIIQEMSDQYRGSNKQSIMNLEPQKPKSEQAQYPIQPIEQNTGKRIVTKGFNYSNNQPETHYMSNRTIEYTKTNQTISDPSININNNQTATNVPKYVVPSSPRIISATPMTITSVSSNSRVYGGYQSPSRVIRKEVTVPEQIVQNESKRQENRITFGSNFNQNTNNNAITNSNNNTMNYSNSNNTLNYSNSNQNITISSSYRNPQQQTTTTNTITSSYYTPQTFNYHTLHNEPYSSKIHVSPGKVENVVVNTVQKTDQVRVNGTADLSPPRIDEKGTKQFVFNYDDYQQIQRDGRIVYRKKMPVEGTKYTPINYVSPSVKVEKEEDESPAVKRYETSPLRREVQNTTTYEFNKASPLVTTYDYNRTRPQITTYDYNRSNSPQVTNYDYNKVGNNNNYNNYSTKNYEVITVPYKSDEHNLGEMIESSHKKKNTQNIQNTQNNRAVDSKNFVTVSYRNDGRNGVSNFNDTGIRVYGVSHPRVEVQRIEQLAPKVQSINPLTVATPIKSKQELPVKASKTKTDLKGDQSPIQAQKNALNQSNWFSRMSELHSDGSILRRNNIRFGVKLHKREQKQEANNSVVQNKMLSGIFKVNDLNKKMALNRIIQGEQYIQEERQKYAHVNPSLNRFHLLLQQDLDYLLPTLSNYLSRPHDRIDTFAGVNSLFAILAPHSELFDIGFVFARQNEIALINPLLLPQNYYLVSIQGEEGLLQINQAQKRVRINQLRHFSLVQRIILDSQLYQYVAYRNSRPEVELLADKFVNSEFILEKIETEFTTQILDCYYYELPRLTRLYVLCDESQLPGLLAIVQSYVEVNPGFKIETCKLVCVLSNILGNEQLIMAHPSVTFISNPQEITHFKHILGYAHHYDTPDPAFLPIDHLFYHNKHTGLEQQLAAYYPGKFTAYPFGKVAEVYSKVQKLNKIAAKYKHQPKVYLVLHESVNAEKVRVEYFSKIFMLGKAKVVQNKVVRVMNTEELLELLKK